MSRSQPAGEQPTDPASPASVLAEIRRELAEQEARTVRLRRRLEDLEIA